MRDESLVLLFAAILDLASGVVGRNCAVPAVAVWPSLLYVMAWSPDPTRVIRLESISRGKLPAVDSMPSKPIVNWPVLPWNEASHTDDKALWKHQHSMLLNELPSILCNSNNVNDNNILSRLLQKYIAFENDHAKKVYESKSRDDVRGANTVPGYKDVHIPTGKDSVVLVTKEEAEKGRNNTRLVDEALGTSSITRSRL